MATVFSVAKYITNNFDEISSMKLQKLAYYAQAWHMAWEEKALFQEDFQAWANGPVCKPLYDKHRGYFLIPSDLFDDVKDDLTQVEKENIDKVLGYYGDKTAQWLSDLTHMEDPWANVRKENSIEEGDFCDAIIEKYRIHEYYSGL